MKAILSCDLNNGIGKDGGLLLRIPEDMKRFKRITMGGTVVMGRKTYESLPGKKPLPGRKNVILSRTLKEAEGFYIADSVAALFDIIKDADEDSVYVIGGGEIYALLMPYITDVYLTVIEHEFDADTFFFDIAHSEDWRLAGKSGIFRPRIRVRCKR